MKVLSLFSGIGATEIAMAGFDGWETVGFCEIEEYPVSILKKRFPGIPIFPDVTKLRGEDVGPVDLICGGFPCQDLSVAGKQRGLFDENGNPTRSGLWYEMLRLVHECRPSWVLAENVRGAVNKALDAVQSDLRAEGYEVRSVVLPASAVGAPPQKRAALRRRNTAGCGRPCVPANTRAVARREASLRNTGWRKGIWMRLSRK